MPVEVFTELVTASNLDSIVAPLGDTLRICINSLVLIVAGPRHDFNARVITSSITGTDVKDRDFRAAEIIVSSTIGRAHIHGDPGCALYR